MPVRDESPGARRREEDRPSQDPLRARIRRLEVQPRDKRLKNRSDLEQREARADAPPDAPAERAGFTKTG